MTDPGFAYSDPPGLGVVRTGAKLITAWHLRQSKVSKSGLSSLDLLASIATPQIGQCLMDGGRAAIASNPHASQSQRLMPLVWRSAQNNTTAKRTKGMTTEPITATVSMDIE
jgi:hypothetical protein